MMEELMDPGVPTPDNCVHYFQASLSDFDIHSKKGDTTSNLGHELKEDEVKLDKLPINIVFALKQRNDGKINSHRQFFLGLCKYLKPEFLQMLDIGTQPEPYAIAKIYKYMRANPTCGAACGEIEVIVPKNISWGQWLLSISQFWEYKANHIPEKYFESVFGFSSVLPGAYSTFRLTAIEGGPMDEFFKLVNSYEDPTCQMANEYLAEDRVMCLKVATQPEVNFYLTYIPDARAFTDCPPTLMVFLK